MPPWISDRAHHRREAAHARAPAEEQTPLEEETSNATLVPMSWFSGGTAFSMLNSTIVTTWALMLVMTVGARLITRKLVTEGAHLALARLP